MSAGQAPSESAEEVRSAPPEHAPSVASPFGDSALAGASLPAGAGEPDLEDGERHVSAARSQSTTSALRRVEYAAKNRALMSRLAEHTAPPNGGGEGIKRTRSVSFRAGPCGLLAVAHCRAQVHNVRGALAHSQPCCMQLCSRLLCYDMFTAGLMCFLIATMQTRDTLCSPERLRLRALLARTALKRTKLTH